MNFKDTEGKLNTEAFVGCRKERQTWSTSKKASPSNIFEHTDVILFWDKLTAICFDVSVVSPSGFLFVNVNHTVNANKLHQSAAQQQRKTTENMKKIID